MRLPLGEPGTRTRIKLLFDEKRSCRINTLNTKYSLLCSKQGPTLAREGLRCPSVMPLSSMELFSRRGAKSTRVREQRANGIRELVTRSRNAGHFQVLIHLERLARDTIGCVLFKKRRAPRTWIRSEGLRSFSRAYSWLPCCFSASSSVKRCLSSESVFSMCWIWSWSISRSC